MPVFFIHGVPETHHLWTPLIERLGRDDAVAIDLPGFGSTVPAGFSATKEAYVVWLIDRIERIGEPVDIVAHDWGCVLAVRLASLRPDLVRTWAGGGGSVMAGYEWHALAKIWQTPGKGEAYFAEFDGEAMTRRLHEDGIPLDMAEGITSRVDPTMGSCILKLYRSALEVGREWQPGLAGIVAPGLVFHGVHDRPVPRTSAEQLARDTGARLLFLDSGHWTPLQRPVEIAEALNRHWAVAEEAG